MRLAALAFWIAFAAAVVGLGLPSAQYLLGAEPVVVTRHRFASLILPPCPVRPATRWPLGGCSSWRSEAAAASMERHQPLVMEET